MVFAKNGLKLNFQPMFFSTQNTRLVSCNNIRTHAMDWTFNTILFDELDINKVYQKDFKENNINWPNKDFENSDYAILWYLKNTDKVLNQIPKSEKLKYLELNWANITDFEIIADRFHNLKRLELHYCVKLLNDNNIDFLNKELEILHINNSKKFQFSEKLLQLKNLKILRLNECAPIKSLEFLKYFPKLEDFRFVNTNILDGNLGPILEHPTIKSVGFLNKRHYNIKDIEMEKLLNKKYKLIITTPYIGLAQWRVKAKI